MLQEIVSAAGGEIIAKRLVALWDTEIGHVIREITERRPPIIFNTLVGRRATASIVICIGRFRAAAGRARPS